MQRACFHIVICLTLLVMMGCSPTKYLTEDELLYDGAQLKLAEPKELQPNAKLQRELLYKVKQEPNAKIFGQRFKLWVYQQFRDNHKEKGLGRWIKTTIGEPPALYDPRMMEQSRLIMEDHLRDKGFLKGTIATDTLIDQQKVRVQYQIDGKGQYTVNQYILPPDTTLLLQLFNLKTRRPFIRPGRPYEVIAINAERLRLENLARNNGFYEFDQSAVYFYVDTTLQEKRKLDIYLTVQPPENQKHYQPHILGDVTIYPDYNLTESKLNGEHLDTIKENFWTMIQEKEVVELKAIKEAIPQDSGAVYSQNLERQAINYLLDFGIFKFVNLKYEKDSVNGTAVLHRSYFLTPSLNQDVGVELEASTERSNFLGWSIGLNYTHRNLFNGAEQLKTGLSFGAETQAGGGGPFINTVESNFDVGLTIPRLLLPFKITSRLKGVIPKTLINLNGSYQKRNTLFTSASGLLELGYAWKQNQKFQHQFYPLQFTLLRLLSTSGEFEQEILRNPRLQASFNDLVILATNYRFIYSTQQLNTRNNFFYFKGELESAGNVASLLAKSGTLNGNVQKTLFNIPISRFARLFTETKATWYQSKTSLVTRLAAGIAIPYGSSKAVPYIRQFFVGGASSIRAFRFRGVGPGSYTPEAGRDMTNFAFFDRVGDVKLEANIEYRFPLFGYLKGAVFLDAGNVWLTKKSGEDLPEGIFKFNQFYKQLAVGTGVGIRLDIQFVVVRLDFGIPLRDPSRPEGDQWRLREISLGDPQWRKENLKFNLAIGYPF